MSKLTKRVELNLGYYCNIQCRFCYYLNSVEARRKDKNLTTEQAKSKLRTMLKGGIKEVEFTGGEPTIRRDLFELVSYAKELGFNNLHIVRVSKNAVFDPKNGLFFALGSKLL